MIAKTRDNVNLPGFSIGPIHGDAAQILLSVLKSLPPSMSSDPPTAKQIAQVSGYSRLWSGSTDDGYEWAGAFVFVGQSGDLVLLIPRATGWTRQGGYEFDRLPCVYGHHRVSGADACALMLRTARGLRMLVP